MSPHVRLCFFLDSLVFKHFSHTFFTLKFVVGFYIRIDSKNELNMDILGCKRFVEHMSCCGILKWNKSILTCCGLWPLQTHQNLHINLVYLDRCIALLYFPDGIHWLYLPFFALKINLHCVINVCPIYSLKL